jgi:predicted ABC-type ATPase
MFIVAGPPGAGKSTAFPVSGFGVDFFNADDRAAALNDGSYLNIPRNVRSHVNTLFESFVLDHIARRSSCAFETTLRSGITFDQAARAREAGFLTEMRYVALRDFSRHLERVKMRADAGGHSAPESVLRAIYEASIRNVPRAIREMDYVHVYDNSAWGFTPTVLLQAESGEVVYLAEDIPHWLARTLG